MNEARLERVSLQSPCSLDWFALEGGGARRYCGTCRLHVTNLSSLPRVEAEAFLSRANPGERICVAFVPGPRGGAAAREDLAARATVLGLVSRIARALAVLLGLGFLLGGCRPAETVGGLEPAAGLAPGGGVEPRRMGRVRADPKCRVNEQRIALGEIAVPDRPEEPGPSPR